MQGNAVDVETWGLQSYVVAGLVSLAACRALSKWLPLASIPAVGAPNFPLVSYLGTFRFLVDGHAWMRRGYKTHKNGLGLYKVAGIDQWVVLVCGSRLIEEVKQAPPEMLSFQDAVNTFFQTEYTLSREIANDPFHADILRNVLPKNLDLIFSLFYNEMLVAFDELIPTASHDWVAVPLHTTTQKIICRASNRGIVGLPLCREDAWTNISLGFSMDYAFAGTILSIFPGFLKRPIATLLSPFRAKIYQARKLLAPVIAERTKARESGNVQEDQTMLDWLMEYGKDDPYRTSMEGLTDLVISINHAALHNTVNFFTHTIYYLSVNPEYITELRNEVEAVVKEHGWSKLGMARMVKLDSCLREALRIHGPVATLVRVARKPFSFSNGVTLPKGTLLGVPCAGVHHDEDIYPNAEEWLPFRHVASGGDEAEAARQLFTAANPQYFPWGLGHHSCPGRHLASNELKAMVGHVLLHYDIRPEVDGVRPKDLLVGPEWLPNMKAKILFRKRQ